MQLDKLFTWCKSSYRYDVQSYDFQVIIVANIFKYKETNDARPVVLTF